MADNNLLVHLNSVVFDQMGRFGAVSSGELRDQISASLEAAYMAGYALGVGGTAGIPAPRTPPAWGEVDLPSLPVAAFPGEIPAAVWSRASAHIRGGARDELALVSADAAAEGDPLGVANSRQIHNRPYIVTGLYRLPFHLHSPLDLLPRKQQAIPLPTLLVQNVDISQEQHLAFLAETEVHAAVRRLLHAHPFDWLIPEPLPVWRLHGGSNARTYGYFTVGNLPSLLIGGWGRRSFFVQRCPYDFTKFVKEVTDYRDYDRECLEEARDRYRAYWERRNAR